MIFHMEYQFWNISQNEKFRKLYLVLIPGYFFIHDLEIHPSL